MAPERLGDEARRVGRERARVLARRLAVQRRDSRFVRGPEHDAADAVLDGGDDRLLVLDPMIQFAEALAVAAFLDLGRSQARL